MLKDIKVRNVVFILFGVALLLAKRYYSGPLQEPIEAYLGNISISFAVYFLIELGGLKWGIGKLPTAGIALVIVELFELTNGYGFMSNTYDSMDYVANAVGVGLALLLGCFVSRPTALKSA